MVQKWIIGFVVKLLIGLVIVAAITWLIYSFPTATSVCKGKNVLSCAMDHIIGWL